VSLPPLDDGGPGDDEPIPGSSGGPPHPMDRIWRHPSELPAIEEPPAGAGRHPAAARARSVLGPLGAGAVGALLTVAVLAAAGVLDQRGTTNIENRQSGPGPAANTIATLARRVAPAIVAVRVVLKSGGSRSGSGVCIRHAGQVLTSDRLIADKLRIDIVTSDGKVQTARVIGRDRASDLALLAIDGDLKAADLADSGSLRIGDPVYTVGADSSGTPWVSEGLVSSLEGLVAGGGTTMSGLIESNALTEPVVAGGALLDGEGRVAGILMTPVSGHPAAIAVPIRFASQVADGLRADGRVDHGWLGLAGKVRAPGRLEITALAAGGPSEKAGIEVGDVVLDADSQPIATMNDLVATARGHWPGERIRLKVTRDRGDLTISVRLARMPTTTTTTAATTTPPTTSTPSTTTRP
jgi:S1-C subfamily serine protease